MHEDEMTAGGGNGPPPPFAEIRRFTVNVGRNAEPGAIGGNAIGWQISYQARNQEEAFAFIEAARERLS
jgi:hypothetical protein